MESGPGENRQSLKKVMDERDWILVLGDSGENSLQ